MFCVTCWKFTTPLKRKLSVCDNCYPQLHLFIHPPYTIVSMGGYVVVPYLLSLWRVPCKHPHVLYVYKTGHLFDCNGVCVWVWE